MKTLFFHKTESGLRRNELSSSHGTHWDELCPWSQKRSSCESLSSSDVLKLAPRPCSRALLLTIVLEAPSVSISDASSRDSISRLDGSDQWDHFYLKHCSQKECSFDRELFTGKQLDCKHSRWTRKLVSLWTISQNCKNCYSFHQTTVKGRATLLKMSITKN